MCQVVGDMLIHRLKREIEDVNMITAFKQGYLYQVTYQVTKFNVMKPAF